MPIVQLSRIPDSLTPPHLMYSRWEAETLAHGFYPSPSDSNARAHWVKGVLREHAREWTSRICPLPNVPRSHSRWFALDSLARTPHDLRLLKPNADRDLRFAVMILLKSILLNISRQQAIREVAEEHTGQNTGNRFDNAIAMAKRAWRTYSPGSHFIAAKSAFAVPQQSSWQSTFETLDFAVIGMISAAEKLRVMGEVKKPAHGSLPVLNQHKMWTIPSWFPRCEIEFIQDQNGQWAIKADLALLRQQAERIGAREPK